MSPDEVLRDLREGKRPRLLQAIHIALYAVIIAAIVFAMNAISSSGAPEWTKYLVLAPGLVVTWSVATWSPGPSGGRKDAFERDMLTVTRHELRARQETFRPLTWSHVGQGDHASAIRDAFAKLQAQPEVVASSGGWRWFAAESVWHGWPDPPRFVVLGFDASNRLGAAIDINRWPRAWSKPDDWPFELKRAQSEESA